MAAASVAFIKCFGIVRFVATFGLGRGDRLAAEEAAPRAAERRAKRAIVPSHKAYIRHCQRRRVRRTLVDHAARHRARAGLASERLLTFLRLHASLASRSGRGSPPGGGACALRGEADRPPMTSADRPPSSRRRGHSSPAAAAPARESLSRPTGPGPTPRSFTARPCCASCARRGSTSSSTPMSASGAA